MADQDFSAPFTLYYGTYSIYSTMARMSFAMRGRPRAGRPDMNWNTEVLDISSTNPEQLSEFYLCKINPEGKVPALANDKLLEKPMAESINITWYLCDWYPDLLPQQHEQTIRDLLEELHGVNVAILTFGVKNPNPKAWHDTAEKLSKQDGASETYKKALDHKCKILSDMQDNLTPEYREEHQARTREVCKKIAILREKSKSEYIFGPQPTALDAHMLVFLRRVIDVGQKDLLPTTLQDWAEAFSQGDLWKEVVPGVTTLPPYAPKPGQG